MPSAEWRRLRLWKISRYSKIALADVVRRHEPTVSDPMLLLVIDEVANLTVYLPDRKLKQRISDALALLLTQGRAIG